MINAIGGDTLVTVHKQPEYKNVHNLEKYHFPVNYKQKMTYSQFLDEY